MGEDKMFIKHKDTIFNLSQYECYQKSKKHIKLWRNGDSLDTLNFDDEEECTNGFSAIEALTKPQILKK